MHSVFAEFNSQDSARKACEAVLRGAPGIVRIGTQMRIPPDAQHRQSTAAAGAIEKTVAHSSAMNGAQWVVPNEVVMNAARLEAEYIRRTGHEPTHGCGCILCAQGSREAVGHAAEILRVMGGQCVEVREGAPDGTPTV